MARKAALGAGVKIVPFDEGEQERFQARAVSAHPQIRAVIGGGLIDAITAAA